MKNYLRNETTINTGHLKNTLNNKIINSLLEINFRFGYLTQVYNKYL